MLFLIFLNVFFTQIFVYAKKVIPDLVILKWLTWEQEGISQSLAYMSSINGYKWWSKNEVTRQNTKTNLGDALLKIFKVNKKCFETYYKKHSEEYKQLK